METKQGEFVQSLDELEHDLSAKSKECDSLKADLEKTNQNLEVLESKVTKVSEENGKLKKEKKSKEEEYSGKFDFFMF